LFSNFLDWLIARLFFLADIGWRVRLTDKFFERFDLLPPLVELFLPGFDLRL